MKHPKGIAYHRWLLLIWERAHPRKTKEEYFKYWACNGLSILECEAELKAAGLI